jgi:hypothetical protein
MAYGDKVDKLIEVYVGVEPDMAKLVAVDEIANKIIGTDIAVSFWMWHSIAL